MRSTSLRSHIKINQEKFMEIVNNYPLVKSFLVGSLSGTCSTIIFQPLDLIKTRLQTPVDYGGRFCGTTAGMTATFGAVLRHESIYGLWKGMTPSITRCVPGVGMYFCSLHWLKSMSNCNDLSPLEAVCMGALARTVTGLTMLPITVVKTRFEIAGAGDVSSRKCDPQSGVYKYKGVIEALRIIYRTEGARGLYCGLVPTIIRDAPFSGIYLMFYTQTKRSVPAYMFEHSLSPVTHFSCGIVAGILASFVTQPADVIKTKMQLYPDKFKSFQEGILFVYQKSGSKGFFRGLAPRMLRRTLMAAMAWTVYEQITKYISLK